MALYLNHRHFRLTNKTKLSGKSKSELLKYSDQFGEYSSFFEQMFIQSATSTQILDRDGWCLRVNSKLCELFGVKPENIEGRVYNIFKDKEVIKNGVDKLLIKVFREKQTVTWDVHFDIGNAADSQKIVVKERKKVWYSNKAYPIVDRNGELMFVIIQHEDVSERFKAAEALKEGEGLFRATFENAQAGICITGLNGRIIRANSKFTEMLGYSEAELTDRSFNEITYPADKKIGMSYLRRMISGEISKASFEKRYIHKNSSIVWVNISVGLVRDAASLPQYFVSHFQDITERIKYEDALIRDERKYRLLFENNPLPMWIYDLKTLKFLEVNHAAIAKYGYSREDFHQMTLKDIRPISDVKALLQNIASAKDDYSMTESWRHIKKNGDIIYVEIISHSIDYNGRKARMVLANDITERKKTQEELVKAKRDAEKSDTLKSEFLAQMSHEIRSPINTMLNFISLIKEEMPRPLKEETVFSFDAIDSSSRRLIRTIDLILNMSQVQTGYLECSYHELDLQNDILKNAVKEYSKAAKLKGLELISCTEAASCIIRGDDYTLTQIFSNLIDNAIKYTKSGKITVRIYNDRENRLSVDVSDTGIGISKLYIEHIFTPFSQEEQGYTRKFEGNGLGLALVNKYCELNSAAISVKSKKGKGTTFTVTFLPWTESPSVS
ncbi:MAG: PAS domain S-box protein [Syntrophothermus sp.]